MRIRLLVIWISLTALLQWSRAQEDNIQEVSISGGLEAEDNHEDQTTDNKENGVEAPSPSFFTTTTEMPAPDKEPVDAVMGTQDLPSDGSQIKEMEHQSGEDKGEPDVPSLGSNLEMDQKKESENENSETSTPPKTPETNQEGQTSDHSDQSPPVNNESSSEVEPNILSKPPTAPEMESHLPNETAVISTGESPDYPNDGPQEDTTPQPTEGTTLTPATPPIPNPVFPPPLSCYSCMFCNDTKNEPKSLCPPIPGKKNGCRTVLVRDPNLIPGKKDYFNRGCISEMDTAYYRYCNENAKLCPTCYEDNCNVHTMTQFMDSPGSGAATHHLMAPFLIWSICLFSYQVPY
ncbi:submandibular gland secretory Glx-rich protein CA [Drosophila eugracilis]|uniref:submandibular gland secretory Glx-rich protein CA n=1 Tax=Drosophila eugracilis TaxID=29029 RepID=UPI001BDA57CD|nr:submandibular gland secretory Glx-rich protein CA [Drosophila eugracilis]